MSDIADTDCDWCDGTGQLDGESCEECGGTGKDQSAGAANMGGWNEIKEVEEDDMDVEPPSLERTKSYTFLTDELLNSRHDQMIAETEQDLNVTTDEADCILQVYFYNRSKAQEDWYTDMDRVRSRGVPAPVPPAKEGEKVQCMMAYCDEVPKTEARALGCGHWICNDCWKGFISSQVTKGPECTFTLCPGWDCKKKNCKHRLQDGCKCQVIVPRSYFKYFLKDDPAALGKYNKWVRDSFVEKNRHITWCPNNACHKVVEYSKDNHDKEIPCECGHTFCFKCGLGAHQPVPCDLAARFLALDSSDALSAKLIAAITKPCPKCGIRIQKNEQCLHMRCSKCGANFCWLCKEDWSTHSGSYWACQKFNEQKDKGGAITEEQKEIMTNQALMQKYTFFRGKYNHHQKQVQSSIAKMKEIENSSLSLSKTKALVDSVSHLVGAHRQLQWSFCLSYFLQDSSAKHLFILQQDELVKLTLELDKLIHGKSTEDMVGESRSKILNDARTVQKYRKGLLEAVERGALVEVIMNEADDKSENWACTRCKHCVPDKHAKSCPKCSACRKHGEKDCWGCNPRR